MSQTALSCMLNGCTEHELICSSRESLRDVVIRAVARAPIEVGYLWITTRSDAVSQKAKGLVFGLSNVPVEHAASCTSC